MKAYLEGVDYEGKFIYMGAFFRNSGFKVLIRIPGSKLNMLLRLFLKIYLDMTVAYSK